MDNTLMISDEDWKDYSPSGASEEVKRYYASRGIKDRIHKTDIGFVWQFSRDGKIGTLLDLLNEADKQ